MSKGLKAVLQHPLDAPESERPLYDTSQRHPSPKEGFFKMFSESISESIYSCAGDLYVEMARSKCSRSSPYLTVLSVTAGSYLGTIFDRRCTAQ